MCGSRKQGNAICGEEEANGICCHFVSSQRRRREDIGYAYAPGRDFLHTMKRHSFSPLVQSFGPNVRIALVMIALGGFFTWLFFEGAREFHSKTAWLFFYSVGSCSGCLILRHLNFRVWVHESGILYRGIFGVGELLWRDFEKVYYGSYDITFHFVTLGVFHRLTLITRQGTKLSIGERLHGSGDLAELIQSYTLSEMIRKAAHEFERGVQLDFGAIRLSRKSGVKYQNWWLWHEIRWENLSKYGVSDTHVNLGAANKLFGVNIRAEKVANVHVLEELLDRVKKKTLSVGP
jgi:hypothetical protein